MDVFLAPLVWVAIICSSACSTEHPQIKAKMPKNVYKQECFIDAKVEKR